MTCCPRTSSGCSAAWPLFAGGCTLAAVEAVDPGGGRHPRPGRRAGRQEPAASVTARGGVARFAMLETIREYAMDAIGGQRRGLVARRAHGLGPLPGRARRTRPARSLTSSTGGTPWRPTWATSGRRWPGPWTPPNLGRQPGRAAGRGALVLLVPARLTGEAVAGWHWPWPGTAGRARAEARWRGHARLAARRPVGRPRPPGGSAALWRDHDDRPAWPSVFTSRPRPLRPARPLAARELFEESLQEHRRAVDTIAACRCLATWAGRLPRGRQRHRRRHLHESLALYREHGLKIASPAREPAGRPGPAGRRSELATARYQEEPGLTGGAACTPGSPPRSQARAVSRSTDDLVTAGPG